MSSDNFTKFLEAVKAADCADNSAFQKLIEEGQQILRLTDKDFAREFNVSRPTITRWRNGDVAPHPALRKHVYEFLRSRAQLLLNRAESLAKRIHNSGRVNSRRRIATGPSAAIPMALRTRSSRNS